MSTSLHFDYGGHYVTKGDGYEWISRGDGMCPLLFKRLSVEEITYSMLLDGVCTKLGVDSATVELKLSFIPLDVRPLTHSYIKDDDDVYVYLTSRDTNFFRSILHIENGVFARKNVLDKGEGLVSRRNQLDKGKGVVFLKDQASSVGNVLTLYIVEEEQNEPMEDEEEDCEFNDRGHSDYSSDGYNDNDMDHEEHEDHEDHEKHEEHEDHEFYEPPSNEEN